MKKRGFTLIELLVVISIIGILASIITVSLSTARAKGRDAKRIADIRSIQLSLEEYYNDNGTFPMQLTTLVPTYINPLPVDPTTGSSYLYVPLGASGCNGTTANPVAAYHLGAVLEQQNTAAQQDTNTCPKGSSCTYGTPATLAACSGSDFYGSSQTCNGTNSSTDLCYDVTNTN